MKYVKWTFWAVILIVVGSFLHYTLPQHDIVRVVNTYQERQDLNDWTRIFWSTPDDQSGTLVNRDVQFISAILTNGKPMVYRNEDTGWHWPPYFKFDTASLQTEADDLKSNAENPKWAVITHYGWRNELFSIFPNAVGIKPISGPDATIIPWVNIFILTVFLIILLTIRAMWRQFKERSIDPVLEDVGEAWDEVEDRADAAGDEVRGLWGRFKGWLGTWQGKPRK
jgi:hypothetical protein